MDYADWKEEFLQEVEDVLLAAAERNVAGEGKMLHVAVSLCDEIKNIVDTIGEFDYGMRDVYRRRIIIGKTNLSSIIQKAFPHDSVEVIEGKVGNILGSVRKKVNAELNYELIE
jgi:hypothetical protein